MITRQLGYNNLFVLEGGLNFWIETIINPKKPASTSPNEELARYDFRQAAGSALGGGGAVQLTAPADQGTGAKPGLVKTPGKKKASGGC